jgi:hypothetical protein
LKISAQTYIRKIFISSLSRAIDYSDCGFCNFTVSPSKRRIIIFEQAMVASFQILTYSPFMTVFTFYLRHMNNTVETGLLNILRITQILAVTRYKRC